MTKEQKEVVDELFTDWCGLVVDEIDVDEDVTRLYDKVVKVMGY